MIPIDFNNPAAFAPFFDDEVTVRGGVPARRHIVATLKCCINECAFEDALDESDAESRIRKLEVSFPIASWPFPEPPQIGDVVEIDSDSAYAAVAVQKRLGDWVLTVRQSMAREAVV